MDKMNASELKPGDVLIDHTMNAKPTRIAEVDLNPSGQVAIRFVCQANWYMLDAGKNVSRLREERKMRTRVFNVRLTNEAEADILAMAEHVAGKPGNLTAGFYALVVEWRGLKAVHEARMDRAAQIMAQEDRLDAMERHDEATA